MSTDIVNDVPELSGINLVSARSVTEYARILRTICHALMLEVDLAADEIGYVLARWKGNPLLFGIDTRRRANKVSDRLHRCAEMLYGACTEGGEKFYQEFCIQFVDVIGPQDIWVVFSPPTGPIPTLKRIPELAAIDFTGRKSIVEYAKALRAICLALMREVHRAGEEIYHVLSKQQGNPLLLGIDMRLRARRIQNRLDRCAELLRDACTEGGAKFCAEFDAQFTKPPELQKKLTTPTFNFS